jgi:DNA-binding transcriptional MerR regulator
MTEDIRHFQSKDICLYLGIDKNRLFHWVVTKRLIRPVVEGKGRGGISLFSFVNILDLALIKELDDFGLELNSIKEIITEKINVKGWGESKWSYFKRCQADGITPWLMIERKRSSYLLWTFESGKDGFEEIEEFLKGQDGSGFKVRLLVSLSKIVADIEAKTGVEI